MNQLSVFVKEEKDDELYQLIIQAIKLYSQSISESNLHYRIVQLITIIESLFIEEDVKWKMEAKSRERICSFVWRNNHKSKNLEITLKSMYEVRHKQIHKAKYLPIDLQVLSSFQILIIEVILQLLVLNKTIFSKDQLISYLDNLSLKKDA